MAEGQVSARTRTLPLMHAGVMLQDILIPCVVLLTTLVAYLIGRTSARSARTSLKTALAGMFECVGAFLLFFGLNVALSATLVSIARMTGSQFVSSYAIEDVTLAILSALQGLLFRFWWHSQ